MREKPIFLGLTRPAKFGGLPMGYFIGLAMASAIPFIALNDWRFGLIFILGYGPLWLLADRHPHLFEIIGTVFTAMPPTKNRKLHGGDTYTPMLEPPSVGTAELIGEETLKDEPSARHLPYLAALTDTIILTRQGDLLASAVVEGIDSFTVEDREIVVQSEAFERHVAQFGEQFAYWVSKITIPETLKISPAEEDPFSMEVDRRWRGHLEGSAYKKRVIVVSVLLRPELVDRVGLGGLLSKFNNSPDDRAQQRAAQMERAEKLEEAMRIIENSNGGNGVRRLKISDGEWLGLLASIQGVPYQKRLVRPGRYLSDAISNCSFKFAGKVVEIDDGHNKRFGAMLGIHEYGPRTMPTLLDSLELPYDIVVTNSYTPMRNNLAVQKMQLRQRQMRATDGPAKTLEEQLGVSADNVASGRENYGYEQLSILVTAASTEELEAAISEVWQAAQETGAAIVRERATLGFVKGPFSTMFFGQAPGNFSYRPRKAMLSSGNFADFSAFHKAQSGRTGEQSPWGEVISLLPTVSSSLYRFNFHEKGHRLEEPSPGHTLVLGRTGSGKTLGTAFLMAQARRVGARVIVFDKDTGLEMAVRALGGSYTAVKIGRATGFNPLFTETDDRGEAWLTDWLTDILARNEALNTVQTVALSEAVKKIVRAPDELRSFSGLESLIASTDDDGELVARVREWTASGRYGWLFSKPTETPIAIGEGILGIDMTEILDLEIERAALLSYLFRRIERVLEDRQPTIIVIDEAWKMLDDEMFRKRLHDWLVTMRKKNCVVMLLTQTPGHLDQSSVGQIIAEMTSTQILYPNARANPEDFKILRLNESEANFLAAGSGGARLALVRSGGDSVIIDFDLSSLGSAVAVLGGGRTGEDRAPRNWRNNPDFWKEMV